MFLNNGGGGAGLCSFNKMYFMSLVKVSYSMMKISKVLSSIPVPYYFICILVTLNDIHIKAALKSSLLFLNILMQAGVDPDIKVQGGRTMLHEACVGGHNEVLKLLLIHVTDMDATNSLGQTACHTAAYHGELGCMKVLEEAGKIIICKNVYL